MYLNWQIAKSAAKFLNIVIIKGQREYGTFIWQKTQFNWIISKIICQVRLALLFCGINLACKIVAKNNLAPHIAPLYRHWFHLSSFSNYTYIINDRFHSVSLSDIARKKKIDAHAEREVQTRLIPNLNLNQFKSQEFRCLFATSSNQQLCLRVHPTSLQRCIYQIKSGPPSVCGQRSQ